MRIKPDPHGTNEQYRAARGTDQLFDGSKALVAWDRIRQERRAAITAKLGTVPPQPGRPIGSKNKKPRRVKERKAVDSIGRVRVCATERKRKAKK
jgi:hypothetical protein